MENRKGADATDPGLPTGQCSLSCSTWSQVGTSEGLSSIEVELPEHVVPGSAEGQRLLRDIVVSLGILDVQDCFHRVNMPDELSSLFCFEKPVLADDFGLVGLVIERRTVQPGEYL